MSDLEFDSWLQEKILDVMHWAPTKPPYRVEVFNPRDGTFYVSGAHCNALGARAFTNLEIAQRVAARANEIAGTPT